MAEKVFIFSFLSFLRLPAGRQGSRNPVFSKGSGLPVLSRERQTNWLCQQTTRWILKVKEVNMENLSEDQIKRQDFVDNQIYGLVRRLNPSSKEIEWDIEMIADIRDTIQHWLVDQYKIVDKLDFYP